MSRYLVVFRGPELATEEIADRFLERALTEARHLGLNDLDGRIVTLPEAPEPPTVQTSGQERKP